MQNSLKNTKISTSNLVKLAILSAIGYILMFISVPLPMLFPEFLKIDISDITALMASVSMGPLAGIVVEFMKNLLQVVTGASTTSGVGEFANFIIGSSFVYTVGVVYGRKKELKSLIRGLSLGVVIMAIVGCITNYFIILPFYDVVAGWDTQSIVDMGAIINPLVTDKITFVIWMIAPFNVLKSVLMGLILLPVYKKMDRLLK